MAVGDDPVRAANTQKFSLDEIDSAYKAKALDRGRGLVGRTTVVPWLGPPCQGWAVYGCHLRWARLTRPRLP
jgi:hypothetical protein